MHVYDKLTSPIFFSNSLTEYLNEKMKFVLFNLGPPYPSFFLFIQLSVLEIYTIAYRMHMSTLHDVGEQCVYAYKAFVIACHRVI